MRLLMIVFISLFLSSCIEIKPEIEPLQYRKLTKGETEIVAIWIGLFEDDKRLTSDKREIEKIDSLISAFTTHVLTGTIDLETGVHIAKAEQKGRGR